MLTSHLRFCAAAMIITLFHALSGNGQSLGNSEDIAQKIKELLHFQYEEERNKLRDLVIEAKDKAVPVLAPELKSDNAWRKVDIVQMLGFAKSKYAIPYLIDVIDDTEETGERTLKVNNYSTWTKTYFNATVAKQTALSFVELREFINRSQLEVIKKKYLTMIQPAYGLDEISKQGIIDAIGGLGIKEAVPILCDLIFSDETFNIKHECIISIKEIKDPRAIQTLINLLSQTDEELVTSGFLIKTEQEVKTLQGAVLVALSEFTQKEAQDAIFHTLTQHPSPVTRARAIEVISDKTFPGAIEALKNCLEDSGVVKGKEVVLHKGVAELVEFFGGTERQTFPDRKVSEYAIDGLAKIGSSEALEIIIDTFEKSKSKNDSAMTATIVKALPGFKDERVVACILSLTKPTDKRVPEEIIESLGRIGHPKTIEFLTTRSLDKNLNPQEREQAINALADTVNQEAVPLLVQLLNDHTHVRTRSSFGGLMTTTETICYYAAYTLKAIKNELALEGLIAARDSGKLAKDELNAVKSAIEELEQIRESKSSTKK